MRRDASDVFRVSGQHPSQVFRQKEQVHRVGRAGIELREALVEGARVVVFAVDEQGSYPDDFGGGGDAA